MAWKSVGLKKTGRIGGTTANKAIAGAVAKHRDEMTRIVRSAKKLAEENRDTLDSIQDADLRRSATR